jgi:hypothetical protein
MIAVGQTVPAESFQIVSSALCGVPLFVECESGRYAGREGASRYFTREGGSQSLMTTYPTARTCPSNCAAAAFRKSSSLKA